MSETFESLIRLRMSTADAHYAGGVVDGARINQLFGDAITEVMIRHDGDEGLSVKMTSEYLAPVRAGDYLEIRARLVAVGRTSRTVECTAHRIIELVHPDQPAARVLATPVLVAKATDIAVVPLERQSTSLRE
jgi:3-aminobutyryl-CoA ammonia-lyase